MFSYLLMYFLHLKLELTLGVDPTELLPYVAYNIYTINTEISLALIRHKYTVQGSMRLLLNFKKTIAVPKYYSINRKISEKSPVLHRISPCTPFVF